MPDGDTTPPAPDNALAELVERLSSFDPAELTSRLEDLENRLENPAPAPTRPPGTPSGGSGGREPSQLVETLSEALAPLRELAERIQGGLEALLERGGRPAGGADPPKDPPAGGGKDDPPATPPAKPKGGGSWLSHVPELKT